MRQESAGVTEALLDSARQEFMEHGFHGASLRRISADSGVSTKFYLYAFWRQGRGICGCCWTSGRWADGVLSDLCGSGGRYTGLFQCHGDGRRGD